MKILSCTRFVPPPTLLDAPSDPRRLAAMPTAFSKCRWSTSSAVARSSLSRESRSATSQALRVLQLSIERGLVLGCMDSYYDSESRRILQHFSRSTRFAFLCTFESPNWKKACKNHLSDLKNSSKILHAF